MSSEANKEVVRRYFEDYHNGRQKQLIDELATDQLSGPTRNMQAAVERAFPDYRISIEWQIADDDAVATGWSAQGTHSGPWNSPAGTIEATGRTIRWTATTTLSIRNGRISGVLGTHWDHLGILQQMGAAESTTPRPGA